MAGRDRRHFSAEQGGPKPSGGYGEPILPLDDPEVVAHLQELIRYARSQEERPPVEGEESIFGNFRIDPNVFGGFGTRPNAEEAPTFLSPELTRQLALTAGPSGETVFSSVVPSEAVTASSEMPLARNKKRAGIDSKKGPRQFWTTGRKAGVAALTAFAAVAAGGTWALVRLQNNGTRSERQPLPAQLLEDRRPIGTVALSSVGDIIFRVQGKDGKTYYAGSGKGRPPQRILNVQAEVTLTKVDKKSVFVEEVTTSGQNGSSASPQPHSGVTSLIVHREVAGLQVDMAVGACTPDAPIGQESDCVESLPDFDSPQVTPASVQLVREYMVSKPDPNDPKVASKNDLYKGAAALMGNRAALEVVDGNECGDALDKLADGRIEAALTEWGKANHTVVHVRFEGDYLSLADTYTKTFPQSVPGDKALMKVDEESTTCAVTKN